MKRYWINQPSTLHWFHDLHGTNVLGHPDPSDPKSHMKIYFTEGDVHSVSVPKHVLSEGWKNKTTTMSELVHYRHLYLASFACGSIKTAKQRGYMGTSTDWAHVNCPDCLKLKPTKSPLTHYSEAPNHSPICLSFNPEMSIKTQEWAKVTCKNCLEFKPHASINQGTMPPTINLRLTFRVQAPGFPSEIKQEVSEKLCLNGYQGLDSYLASHHCKNKQLVKIEPAS